jgi:hypothetical protein
MRAFASLAMVSALFAWTCGGSNGGTVTGAGGNSQVNLAMTVSGRGTIRATSPAFECSAASCTQALQQGVQVHLDAVPSPGSAFDGWNGACSGTGGCDLLLDADKSIGASFRTLPVLPGQLSVDVQVNGQGDVRSDPAGIDCGATCHATFDAGISPHLLPTARAGFRFDGWGGACTGPGDCRLQAGDASVSLTVFATFVPVQVTSTECDGIVPASLGPAATATTPAGFCEAATSDLSGAVAIDQAGTWFTFSSSGASLGKIPALDVVPLDSGFAGVTSSDPDIPISLWSYHMWAADGSSTFQSSVGSDACLSLAFPSSTGGALVLSNCGNGRQGDSRVIRFDASGNRVIDGTFLGIYQALPALRGDANGNTLAVSFDGTEVGLQPTDLVARWLDGKGALLTGWFAISSGGTVSYSLQSAIGGGAFVQQDGVWRAFLPSGSAAAQPAPEWLAARTGQNLSIVRGRKAYALTSRSGGSIVELFAPSGTRCGSIDVGGGNVSIGGDGTVFTQTTTNSCRRDFFPGLLR